MQRHVLSAIVLAFAAAGPAWADGYEFFTVDRGKAVNLAYVGQIREKGTGRIVREPAYFMVTEKRSGMTFPFANDRPGHYRSPDIGESVEELAGTSVNPKDLEFSLEVTGYRAVQVTGAPRKNKGVVELNFIVERDAENTVTESAGAHANAAPEFKDLSKQATAEPIDDSASRLFRLIFMGVAAVSIIGGAVARTSGLRRATGR